MTNTMLDQSNEVGGREGLRKKLYEYMYCEFTIKWYIHEEKGSFDSENNSKFDLRVHGSIINDYIIIFINTYLRFIRDNRIKNDIRFI